MAHLGDIKVYGSRRSRVDRLSRLADGLEQLSTT
jgi:hypothetical protein